MYTSFLEKYVEEEEETILDDTIDQFNEDQVQRNEELFAFIEDFVNSEEYEEYLERKRNIIKIDASTQYWEADLEPDTEDICEIIEDKYPLTTENRKMWAFIRKFEKYTNNKTNLEVLRKQENGIKIIKEKIAEARKIYCCKRSKVFKLKELRDDSVLDKFCESYNIDLSNLSLKSRNGMKEKIVCYQKIVHSRKLKIKCNIMEIVRKLTDEYKRQKEIDETLNKDYSYKVKRKEKIMKDMEIVGEQIILKPEYEIEVVEEVHVEEEAEVIVEKKDKTKKKDKKDSAKGSKKGKGDKKKKDKKSSKKTSKKDSKKSGKKKKKDDSELVLPVVPVCNLRKKVSPENYEKMLDLISEFQDLEDALENEYILAQEIEKSKLYELDNNFLCTPKALLFKNFEDGKTYKKKARILNISTQFQKFRLLKTVFSDEYDSLLFEIKPVIGIQKLAPGRHLDISTIFIPKDGFTPVEGKIVFLSYNTNTLRYHQFFIHIECIPSHADLIINPAIVNFGKIPIWKAKNAYFKNIKLRNASNKHCKLVIKKVPDPLELMEIDDNAEIVDENEDEACVKEILKDCIDNIFNNFNFESSYFNLKGFDVQNLKITFKYADHVGNYFEKFTVDVYEYNRENILECVGCQELYLSAEITDHFLKAMPDVLDFGVCIINSIYQLSFDLYNNSSTTQTICIKFPAVMADNIKSDSPNFYINPQAKRTVWLKFMPRNDIFKDNVTYYDKQTSILEFPIHICVLSKTYPDAPPVRATVFSIVTTQKSLAVTPSNTSFCAYFQDALLALDLGDCTTYETVYTEIEIENNTLAPQIFGFPDIPECVTLSPNYGFGEICPNEKKVLKIYFHPDVTDMPSFLSEGRDRGNNITFRITLETISYAGQTKKEFNYKKLRKSFEYVLKELKSPQTTNLMRDMQVCAYYIKSDLLRENAGDEQSACNDINLYKLCEGNYRGEYFGETEIKIQIRNPATLTQLWLNAHIIRPLLEFSHQLVEFPATPCGSYSIVQIELRAFKSEFQLECDFFKRKPREPLPDYEASFTITGGNEEIQIEPTCGMLRNGQFMKIILIVKPKTPEEIITDTAKFLKYTEIYEKKLLEYQLKKQKQLEKGSKKDKKGKKEKDKKSKEKKSKKGGKDKKSKDTQESKEKKEERPPVIVVTEKELQLSYLDLYPAEMFYWRNLQPYNINTKFTCNINYKSDGMSRKPETIYLDASCTVIKPDFITNLKLQRIDFGKVAIGMKKVEPVIIQNINYTEIEPKLSLLNPMGPFDVPYIKSLKVPPEHFLELPIIFEPALEEQVEEYFEIRSGGTTLSLIFQGTGEIPKINITPNFAVFRLETKKKDIAEYSFEIKNKGGSEITITVEKLFELEGFFKEPPKEKEIKEVKKGGKGKKDKSKKDKKSKGKAAKDERFSNKLTEIEEYSLKLFFTDKSGDIYFDILGEGKKLDVKANSGKAVKIGFGVPEVLAKKKAELIKKMNEKVKGKKDKGGKNSKSSKDTKSSKKSKTSKGNIKYNEKQKFYVTKYNFMLNKVFIKDVILICTITGK